MYRITFVALGLLAFSHGAAGKDEIKKEEVKKDDYLTKEGLLAHALTIKTGQSGFAGVSGEMTLIEPNGTWTVSTHLNDKPNSVLRKGKLGKEDLQRLAKVMAEQKALSLPKSLGASNEANPAVVSMIFGKNKTSVAFSAGEKLPNVVKKGGKDVSAEMKRLSEIVVFVDALTAKGEKGGPIGEEK